MTTTIDVLGRTVTLDVSDDEFVVDAVVILRTQRADEPNSRILTYGSSPDHFITVSMLNSAGEFFGIGEQECTCDGDDS